MLEDYWEQADPDFLALYPEGIELTLQTAKRNYSLFRARLGDEDLSQDERDVRILVERSKRLRSSWLAAAPALREALTRDQGLIRGDVRLQVHPVEQDFLNLREALYRLAFKHLPKLTRQDVPYPPSFRLRAISISLLAAITLYENAPHAQRCFLTIPGVRAIVSQGDPTRGIPHHL